MSATVIMIEFDKLSFVDELNDNVYTALTRALNRAADRSRTQMVKEVRLRVPFPASYVSPSNKRLWVKTRAKKGFLQTVIEGRGEPTSLARFTKSKVGSKGPINVTVKPGVTKAIKRAFLVKLKNNNIGLAVRTNGDSPTKAYKPKPFGKNSWLLFGPSVDQVLSAASAEKGVFYEMSPEVLDFVEQEFDRQMELLNG